MTDGNTMGRWEYVGMHAFWIAVTVIWYRVLLFIPLEEHTAGESKAIMWTLVAAMATVGMLVTFRKRRNYVNLLANTTFPFQVYAMMSYSPYFGTWVAVTGVLAVLFAAAFCGLVILGKGEWRRAAVMKKRIRHALLGTRIVVVVCLCTFIVPLGVKALVGDNLLASPDNGATVYEEAEEWTIENRIHTVAKIKPSVWETLSLEQRLEVLSVIKNIEMQHLGIHHEVYLTADKLAEYTLGSYYPNEHKIAIDIAHLKKDPVDEVVHSLLHECHHVYTHQQMELYKSLPEEYKKMPMFADVRVYEYEYENYINSTESVWGYTTQYCEAHANEYAIERAVVYYEEISDYDYEGGYI